MKTPDRKSLKRLEDLPNIGPAMKRDLEMLGIRTPRDLLGKDAFALHNELCVLTGQSQDPCVIDVFLSVIRFMEGAPARPWWNYTALRKEIQAQKS